MLSNKKKMEKKTTLIFTIQQKLIFLGVAIHDHDSFKAHNSNRYCWAISYCRCFGILGDTGDTLHLTQLLWLDFPQHLRPSTSKPSIEKGYFPTFAGKPWGPNQIETNRGNHRCVVDVGWISTHGFIIIISSSLSQRPNWSSKTATKAPWVSLAIASPQIWPRFITSCAAVREQGLGRCRLKGPSDKSITEMSRFKLHWHLENRKNIRKKTHLRNPGKLKRIRWYKQSKQKGEYMWVQLSTRKDLKNQIQNKQKTKTKNDSPAISITVQSIWLPGSRVVMILGEGFLLSRKPNV